MVTSYIHEHGDDSKVDVNGHAFNVKLLCSRAEAGAGMNLKAAKSFKGYRDMKYAKA
ncbi:autotransporter outer membrane beta-barrel domain-containing protein [Pseudomonas sp. NPDC078700]|uniref:autotransporter outer membrane beta-barrel domain-containing protein n=1 Tax=Pseudomonas sp. NPDC078700 TaxID=3364424 RepID=UPI0037CA9D0D